jgi:hypothetical protein
MRIRNSFDSLWHSVSFIPLYAVPAYEVPECTSFTRSLFAFCICPSLSSLQILYHVMLLLIARGDRASVRRATSLIALLRLVPAAVWTDAHSPESSIYVPFFAQALTGSGLSAALGATALETGFNGSSGSIVSNASLDCGPILSVFGSLWGHSRVVDSTLCALFDSLWPTLTNASSMHAHAYAPLCAEVSRLATERSVLDATTRAVHPNLFGGDIAMASGAGHPASDAMNE